MHWPRFLHSGMHWLGSPIRACIDSGVNKCILYSLLQMILCHCVIKWLHSVKSFIDLESAHQGLSFSRDTTRYVFCNFKIWPWGTPFLTLMLTMKVIGDRPSKLISRVADQVLLSNQVWSWSNKKYSKNKVFVSIMTWPDFDLWPWPLSFGMMVTNTLILLYANDDVP
jgi:hypothetical protein